MTGVQVLVVTTSSRSSWFELACEGVRSAHPAATVVPVLADGRLLVRPGPDAVLPQRLDVGPFRYVDLVLALGARDAAWAALPWILDDWGARLGPADGPVVVIADTVSVQAPLDELLGDLGPGGALARSRHHDRATDLPWGGCLPGFLALGDTDAELLEWWRGRALAALAPPSGARATPAATPTPFAASPIEQLWRDLPVGDSLRVTADPGTRLSAATAGELEVHDDGDGWRVDDSPLLLADLDGFDPDEPWWFAPPGEAPRRYLSESPALRRLTRRVAERLGSLGWEPVDEERLAAVPGVATTPELRSWYRDLLARAVAPGATGQLPPNPYVRGQVGEFLDLLAQPEPEGSTAISAHADLVMAHRPDLAAAFPGVRWSGRDAFVRWMWTHGLDEGVTSLALLPDQSAPPARRERRDGPRPFGVNLVGYLTGELGLGVAARRMQAALEAAGVPVATVSYDRTSSRRSGAGSRQLDAPYHVNLLVITPDQLPFFVDDVGAGFFEGHHNVGLWYWETDVLTDRQISSFRWVDEVWGATRYLCDVFERYDRVPVQHVPVPLVFEDPQLVDGDRARLGLDDRFTVLFSFDFLSVVERKNPLGLVDAYCRAFGPDDGARLILKGINGEVFPDKLEQLLDAVADRPDIDVWDRYLSSRDRLALVALVDCYASLHRSEGLGLTMAEAMALGTPVVATAYSGNLDFMDEDSALLVPYQEVLIGEGHLYPAEGHWAEPDLDVAAAHLRRLFDDPDLRRHLGDTAPVALARFGVTEVARVVERRLDAIGTNA